MIRPSGVSLVQTADGALAESSNILQRVRELAVQAANGTNNTTNREALDREVQQLLEQIEDIALDTEFNGVRVLSSAQTMTIQAGPKVGQTLTIAVEGAKSDDLGISTVDVSSTATAVSAARTLKASSARRFIMRCAMLKNCLTRPVL